MGSSRGHGNWAGNAVTTDDGQVAQRQIVEVAALPSGSTNPYPGADYATTGNQTGGAQKTQVVDSGGNGYAAGVETGAFVGGSGQVVFPVRAFLRAFDPTANDYRSLLADAQGLYVHAPKTTVTDNGGTIAASGGTAALAFTSTTRGEVINGSTATLWARWGAAAAVNGPGSFPITPGGSYGQDRVQGTLNLLSTAANQSYAFNKFG